MKDVEAALAEEEELIDVKQTQQTIASLKNELVAVEDKMNKYLVELGF